jgi:hypothetical protein
MPNILVNRIRLPSGKYLESRSQWNFVQAEGFFVDGGNSYVRTNMLEQNSICTVYDTDPIEVIRDALRWGTFGKPETDMVVRVKLKDLSNAHLDAIMLYVEQHPWAYREYLLDVFKREKEYRKENAIDIADTDFYNVDYTDEYHN